jgi:hypothetical protein
LLIEPVPKLPAAASGPACVPEGPFPVAADAEAPGRAAKKAVAGVQKAVADNAEALADFLKAAAYNSKAMAYGRRSRGG